MVATMQSPADLGGMIHTQAIASFYSGLQPNEGKTAKAGRPIFDDVEMIKIVWSGNTKSEFHAPATDRCDRPLVDPNDKRRYFVAWKDHPDFKRAYDAFKAGQELALSGTPLSELPFLTEARRAELRAINILTAEALVGLDTKKINQFGIGQLRDQAKAFLDRAAGAAVDAQHAAEKKAMQDKLDAMQAQIDALSNGSAPKAKAKEPASNSPFESWEDDAIRAYLRDADPSAPAPPPRLGHAKLVAMADEVNERLKSAA